MQVKLARRNRARLVQMVPNLLVKLRQGLQLISYPEERIAEFLDELIALHEKAFETVRAVPPGTPIESVVDRRRCIRKWMPAGCRIVLDGRGRGQRFRLHAGRRRYCAGLTAPAPDEVIDPMEWSPRA